MCNFKLRDSGFGVNWLEFELGICQRKICPNASQLASALASPEQPQARRAAPRGTAAPQAFRVWDPELRVGIGAHGSVENLWAKTQRVAFFDQRKGRRT